MTAHGDMTEASLNGYVVDFYITIREGNLKCLFIIKHVVDCSHHHRAKLGSNGFLPTIWSGCLLHIGSCPGTLNLPISYSMQPAKGA